MVVCDTMMSRNLFPISLILPLIAVMAACTPQMPIPVFITPTPEPVTQIPTLVPTLEVVEPVPTIAPSLTPESSPDVVAPSRTPMQLGAVVGPDYTLQPSNTPRPTRTNIATVPSRPSATPQQPGEATAGPSPTPLPVLDPQRVGLQLYTNLGRPEWDYYLQRTREVGVGWIKVQANWAFLQPNGADANAEVMRTFEINLETASQYGYKILLSVAKAPPYLRSVQGDDAPPDNPQELVNFLNLMFTQTKIGEVVDAIEIWNEPNLKREWNTNALPFGGEGYMQLFAPAYQAIKAYRSDIIVVTAGLAPTGTSPFSIDDRTYLSQMYAAGLGQYTDVVVGVHPYAWGNPPDVRCCVDDPNRGWDDNPHFYFLDNLDAPREIMNANGHGSVPIWVTEFGYATWRDLSVGLPDPQENNLWMNYLTPEDQANYTIRAVEIMQKERSDVGVVFLWNLNFANELTVNNRQEIVAYSLMLPDDIKRPLYFLLPAAFTGR
jgi:polysaccharide biosynthesis protein PslG